MDISQRSLNEEQLQAFGRYLRQKERAGGTVEKYLRDLRAFARWLEGGPIAEESAAAWKEHLLKAGYAPTTINSMLAGLQAFFRFMGWENYQIKFLKLQRRMFRDARRELTRAEYDRLLETARTLGQERLALLMEAIGATGIRVSEVRYITVEAARRRQAEITLKGKIRTILLPKRLCQKLLKYARTNKTASGEIFLTRSGKPLGRRQIWAEMKRLCAKAGVEPGKVFPHNLRHLFATLFHRACKDIARLADVLGHSSIETTRIYLLTTGSEHRNTLDRLGLVT